MNTLPPPSESSLRSAFFLLLGFVLICLPLNPAFALPAPRILITALLCGGFTCAIQLQIASFFQPPAWLRWCFLPALLCSPPFLLLALPSPLSTLISLLAFAWLLNHSRLPAPPLWGRVVLYTLIAVNLLTLQGSLPFFDFPRLPSSTPFWIMIAAVLPLGIATQRSLRKFARNVILAELMLVYLALSLVPLTVQTVTGFKEVGEPERSFFSLDPLPGFRTVPNFGRENFSPSELRNVPDPLVAVGILEEMNLSLQPHRWSFPSSDLSDDTIQLLLQQTGFLQKDRFGFFVPALTYSKPEPPEDLQPEFMDTVDRLAQLTWHESTPETRPILLRLRNLNLVDTLPGNSSRFRLTPQARRRFGNGLFPRQILFASDMTSGGQSKRIRHADYAPEWHLSFDQTRLELIQLVDAGVLSIDESPSWHAALPEIPDFRPLVIAALLSLAGVMLLGTVVHPDPLRLLQSASFALAILTGFVLPTLPGPEAPLVFQAVWSTLWLPFAALFFGFAMR